jgi:malate permease and related proteins
MKAVIEKIFILFFIVLVGAVLKLTRGVDDDITDDLSKIIVDVTLPALYFYILATSSSELLLRLWFVPLFSCGVIIGGGSLGFLFHFLFKKQKIMKYLFAHTLGFSNTAFLAIPLLYTIMGKDAASCAAVFNIGFTICWWTFGVFLLSKHTQLKGKVPLKNFLTPGLVLAVAGLLFGILDIKLPSVLMESISQIGSITVPLAMLTVGFMLANKENLTYRNLKVLSVLSGMKLIFIPAVCALILYPLNINVVIKTSLVLLAAMPCSSSAPIFVKKYRGMVSYSLSAVFTTTILSILTIPVWVYILDKWY